MKKQVRIRVSETRCKQCGICAALCPRHVLEQETGRPPVAARPEDCTGCRLCELRCPDFAIEAEVQ